MFKRGTIAKCTAFLVLAGVTMGMLTGCGGGKAASSGAAMDKDHVYHGEYYALPEGMTSINSMKVINDHIYIDGYNEKNNYRYQIISMNTDGTDLKTLYEAKEDGSENIATFSMDQEGNSYLFKCVYSEDASDPENIISTNTNFIIKLDAEGKQILEKELKVSEDFYPNAMMVDKNGNLIILSYNSMDVFDKEIEPVTSVDTSNGYIDSLFLTDDGKVMVTQYSEDYTGREIKEYDESSKQFSEAKDMGEGMSNFTFYQATGYDLFLKDSTDLYGFDLETGEKTKLLNWIDSDINGNFVNGLAGLSDGRIVCCMTNWMENKSEIAILTKVEPKDVIEKTVLTLATVYESDLSSAIIEFNKKSELYRITLKDYSVYNTEEDYMAAYNKLNTDIISGNVPDILYIDEMTPFESYTSKGLFLDLYELMDQDETFNRADYLENIFEAFEENGKLYSITAYFNPYSVIGKTSLVGDKMGWTLADLRKVMESRPEGTKILSDVTDTTIMFYGNYLCMDEFVDWEKGTCNFESQGFKDLLEFANEFPTQEEYEKGMENAKAEYDEFTGEDLGYRKGTTLLQFSYLSGFKEFHRLQKVTYGEDITFIGFPSESTNGSAISPGLRLAVSSKTASKEAAWEFIKSFLTDEYQDARDYGWPVKLSSLEKKMEKEKKPETYIDENGKEVAYEETYMENGKEKKLGTVTDEECEKVMTFIKSLNHVLHYDESINEIINEETGAYFSGQKSVDETCKLIQNRVQTYISESR